MVVTSGSIKPHVDGSVEGLAHRADKWTRLSAQNDALLKRRSIGWIPKVESTFGSDARIVQTSGPGFPR
jgi:hypothetical protein